MNIIQESWTNDSGWQTIFHKGELKTGQIVFAFGNRKLLSNPDFFQQIKDKYPGAEILISSTSGEIDTTGVVDDSIVITAIELEKTSHKTCCVNIKNFENSYDAGKAVVDQLSEPDLNHVFVLSDGHLINGSELVKGLNQFECKAAVTGGLAGDGYEFNKTLVGLNAPPAEGNIVAIGFYGNQLQVGFGSKGGWDTFGPERKVTKSEQNVLYELDGQSALELYKKYLGEASKELPGSALYYPLSIIIDDAQAPIVRTVLSVDEEKGTMTFAGDIPNGAIAQLMMHNSNKLIDGAEEAAENSCQKIAELENPDLVILVSCVGRKLVLGQKIDDEVDVVRELVGNNTAITGFYSYGEIAPFQYFSRSELHNQTMTITTFSEL